jgi:hypothetical protein
MAIQGLTECAAGCGAPIPGSGNLFFKHRVSGCVVRVNNSTMVPTVGLPSDAEWHPAQRVGWVPILFMEVTGNAVIVSKRILRPSLNGGVQTPMGSSEPGFVSRLHHRRRG